MIAMSVNLMTQHISTFRPSIYISCLTHDIKLTHYNCQAQTFSFPVKWIC